MDAKGVPLPLPLSNYGKGRRRFVGRQIVNSQWSMVNSESEFRICGIHY